MTEADVRRIVAEMFGIEAGAEHIASVQLTGNVAKKMVGDLVTEAGLQSQYVLVDFSKARSIGGRKVWWR